MLNQFSDTQKAFVVWLLLLPFHIVFLKFNGPFSFDEGVYLATVKALQQGGRLFIEIDFTQWPLFAYVLKGASDLVSSFLGRPLEFHEFAITCRALILAHGAILATGFSRLLATINVRGRLNTLAVFLLLSSSAVFFVSHTILGNIPAIAWAIFALSSERIGWMAIALNMKLVAAPFALLFKKRTNILASLVLALLLAFLTGFPINGVSSLQGGALTNPIERTSLIDRILWLIEGHGIRPWGESGVLKHSLYSPLIILGFISCLYIFFRWIQKIKRSSLNLKDELQWPSIELRSLLVFAIPLFAFLVHSTVWKHHIVILFPGAVLGLILVLKDHKMRSLLNVLALFQIGFIAFTTCFYFKANQAWANKTDFLINQLKNESIKNVGLISDHPWLSLQSGNPPKGPFVDPSRVRIRTGQISCNQIITTPKQFILSSDRFSELNCPTPFTEYLLSQGYKKISVIDDFTLWGF